MIIIVHMKEEYVKRNAIQPPLQCGTFEQELIILYGCMVVEVQ